VAVAVDSAVVDSAAVGNNKPSEKDERGRLMKKIFLTPDAQAEIVAAVVEAESMTAGEIMVSVVDTSTPKVAGDGPPSTPLENVDQMAEQKFMELGIQQTKGKTGVLILISLAERMVSVKADKAINDLVPKGTWQQVVETITSGIRNGNQCRAICQAVRDTGNLLEGHFPIQPGDVNELSDEIDMDVAGEEKKG
jgi:uncharacterized membrane protein